MIFVSNGRPEQGKDAIAQRLRHIALIAMHGIHHELQGGVNNRPCLFGVESFNKSSRAFEVSKEGSDRFAFALACPARFQRGLLRAYTFREVGRCVAYRSSV